MYCEKCGHEIPEGQKYCENCGWKVPAAEAGHEEKSGTADRKKWILIGAAAAAVILIICLIALPGSSGNGKEKGLQEKAAAQETDTQATDDAVSEPDEETLEDFLRQFIFYEEGLNGGLGFDSTKTDALAVMKSIMWNIPCVEYALYPGEENPAELSMTGDSDPRGMILDEDGGTYMMCYVYDEEKINWIMQNIFNYPQSAVDAAVKESEAELEQADITDRMMKFYCQDGKYYFITGGIGWETEYDVAIDSMKQDGDMWNVDYTVTASYLPGTDDEEINSEKYFAKMQYKEIDGDHFWSLYEYRKK